jgi:predicted XRE-type DNA-binding protein
MRNAKAPVNSEIEHVTTGDIFGDLGFSPAQALELTIKSDLHRSLLEHIRASKMTQVELAQILRVHQPDVSNLLRGKLSLFSITKLCQYADRLKLRVRIEVQGIENETNAGKRSVGKAPRRTAPKTRSANHGYAIQPVPNSARRRAIA